MAISKSLVLTVFLSGSFALGQSSTTIIPTGTPLPVSLPNHLPMKIGTPVRAALLYDVYVNNALILPAKTVVLGSIVSLAADKPARVRARLRADFTPLRTPVVSFTSLLLVNGASVPITASAAVDGAPVYRVVASPPPKGRFISQQFQLFKQAIKDRIAVFTSPDKADRASQFLYSQLPYHPQRVAKGTAWTIETRSPVTISLLDPPRPLALVSPQISGAGDERPTQILQAYLSQPISSATSNAGDAIKATIAEPVYNPDGSVAVPQGSILTGVISKARPARKLSRPGVLQFSFRQLALPGQEPQPIRASLTGADSATDSQLTMDAEGEVKPKTQNKLVVPVILLSLAARPLDQESGGQHHAFAKNAVASNSLGLLGFIIGTAAQRPNVAAGIGYYGAAVSIYQRIFAKGKEVAFVRDTRIVVQSQTSHSAPIE